MHNRRNAIGCMSAKNNFGHLGGMSFPPPRSFFLPASGPSQASSRRQRVLAFLAERAAAKAREEERQRIEKEELLEWRRKLAIANEHMPNPDRRERRNVEEDRRVERDSIFPRFYYKE